MNKPTKPIKPALPFSDNTLRVPVFEPVPVTREQYEAQQLPGDTNFTYKEVPVYTKAQLEAYGRQMQVYGLMVAQSICNEYDESWYAYRKGAAECSHIIGLEILTAITPDGPPLPTRIIANTIPPKSK